MRPCAGDLVVIGDAIKNTEVTQYMQSFSDYESCGWGFPWLGAEDCNAEGCTWVDGSPWVRAAISHICLVASAFETS